MPREQEQAEVLAGAGRTRETALRTHSADRWLIRWAALRRCPLLFEPHFDAAYARSELDGG